MNLGYENDRRFFTALIVLSLGCFVLESILRAYGLPDMPLRFGLKALATFIGIGVFSWLLVRYKADRFSFVLIFVGLCLFVLTRAFEIETIHQFGADLLGMSSRNFSRIVDNSVEKTAIYCVVLSLISLIIVSAKRRQELVHEVKVREQAEERVQASADQLKILFEAAPCALSQVSLDRRHVMVNRKFCELVGYGAEELKGMSVEALVEPGDRDDCDRVLAQLLEGNHGEEVCEVRYRHKNGFAIWVQNTVQFVTNDQGQDYLLVACEDVTERRRRMLQLSDSVSLLEATIESTTDGILVVDLDQRITRYNQRFLEMWGLSESVMHSMSDRQVVSFVVEQLEDPSGFLDRINELYQDVESEGADVIRFRDGRIFERFSKPQYVDGKPSGRVWGFRDVTAERKAEAEQSRLQIQVRDAQKMEALGTLARGVAHDFNNILSSIMTNTEVVTAMTKDHEEVQECLEDIRLSGERARDLIGRIQNFSRTENRKTEPLALGAILADAEKLIRPVIPSSIDLNTDVEPNLPKVLGSGTQFHQVFLNLCSNAAAAIEGRGKILIQLNLHRFDSEIAMGGNKLPAGSYVRIQVADSGRGMDAVALRRATEPFYSTKGAGEGSGLGLTVVNGIVKSCGGGMRLESQVDHGTKVELFFPIADDEDLIAHSVRVSGTETETAKGAGQRILFVDDEESVAKSIEKRMRQLNYRLSVFTDPVEAQHVFETDPDAFDLIMTDLTMPGANGIEFASRVRSIRGELPVILLTGYGDPSIHQQATAAGVSVILKKPVDGASMSWAVKEALDRGGRPHSSALIVS